MSSPSVHHALPRFRPGRLFATPASLDVLERAGVPVIYLLMRHICGDWGDLDDADRQQNELALASGARLLSSYAIRNEGDVWIITEANRLSTTVLLPQEY